MTTLSNNLHVISNKFHYEVPSNVSFEWVRTLARIFDAVQSSSSDFPENFSHSLVNFVLHGENIHIDHKIRSAWPLEYFFLRHNVAPQLAPLLHTLYSSIHTVPAPIVVRWAQTMCINVLPLGKLPSTSIPSHTVWPEVIAQQMADIESINGLSPSGYCSSISMALFESWLKSDTIDATHLFIALLTNNKLKFNLAKYIISLPDYADALDRYLNSIRQFFRPETLFNYHTLFILLSSAHSHTLKRLSPELTAFTKSDDSHLRATTIDFIRRFCDAIPELMILANEAEGECKSLEYLYFPAQWTVSETPTIKNLISRIWEQIHSSIRVIYAKNKARNLSYYGDAELNNELSLFNNSNFDKLCQYLNTPVPYQLEIVERRYQSRHYLIDCITRFINDEAMTPVVLFKLLVFFNQLSDEYGLKEGAKDTFNLLYQKKNGFSLLELSMMMDESGNSGSSLIYDYCKNCDHSLAEGWDVDDLWPYLSHHLVRINELITSDFLDQYNVIPAKLFFLISTLPSIPSTFANTLMSFALGSIKRHRRLAQDALITYKPKLPIIFNELRSKKSEARTIAAQWLTRLKEPSSLAPLEAALDDEKNDVAKAAMLDALEQLGQPLEKYINRSTLIGQATRDSAVSSPKELAWLSLSSLPVVKWADDKLVVPPAVLNWLIVQAVKLKSPEPNSLIRKYCSLFDNSTRHEFGNYIFEKWLEEDLRGDAMKIALEKAHHTARDMIKRPSAYKNNPLTSLSIDELIEHFLALTLKRPAGSAIDSKGLLGLVAACADQTVVKPAAEYLKNWYGSRAAQGKALIAMLAWIEHPSAIQFVLSIGSRFRTKTFQEEALKHAEALADRNGWTLMQLADRSVPTAGFDEQSAFHVDYGSRQFILSLLPNLDIALHTMEGKGLAKLPTPSAEDDDELVKQAKKLFSSAKKEVKNIATMQTQQLYQACCIQREWELGEWSQYLRMHPITGKLVERLVWMFSEHDGTTVTFRPEGYERFIDAHDNEILIPENTRIRLAHGTVVSGVCAKQWQDHIKRHRLSALFEQFSSSQFMLSIERENQIDINDFRSYILESFTLKNKASKLGYARGPSLDGGWFYTYEKRFLSIHLKAVITFTGAPLPEENTPVSLINLCFMDINKPSSWSNTGYTLSRVPPVLLSECYNDIRIIAEAGQGYDSDWLKNNGFNYP